MGIPAPLGVSASGIPPQGDQANAVLSGILSAVGPSPPFAFRGPFNLVAYASYNTSLQTTSGSTAATLGTAGSVAAGESVNSVNVPPGTTVQSIVGPAAVLQPPVWSLQGDLQTGQARISGLRKTTGLIGATIVSPYFPAGTTVTGIITPAIQPQGSIPGSVGTLGVVSTSNPPLSIPVYKGSAVPVYFTFNLTANAFTTGTDNAALFTGADIKFTGSFQIERSFDGGSTWIVCNVGGAGTLAQYTAGTPVSMVIGEPEKNVLYRINVTALSGGNINYRISTTGGAAESLAISSAT